MQRFAYTLCLGLFLTAFAPAPQAATPPLPANARALLRGTWQSMEDKEDYAVITDKQYIEKHVGLPDAVNSLTLLTRPCDDGLSTGKPDGSLYLQATPLDPQNDGPTCYAVEAVSNTRLSLIFLGRTLNYRRVPAAGKK